MNRKQHIEALLKEDASDPFMHYALALEVAKEGNIETAIEQVTKLLNKFPNYLGAYYQLGKWLEAIEDFEAAIQVYRNGIQLAANQENIKAKNELEQALWLIED